MENSDARLEGMTSDELLKRQAKVLGLSNTKISAVRKTLDIVQEEVEVAQKINQYAQENVSAVAAEMQDQINGYKTKLVKLNQERQALKEELRLIKDHMQRDDDQDTSSDEELESKYSKTSEELRSATKMMEELEIEFANYKVNNFEDLINAIQESAEKQARKDFERETQSSNLFERCRILTDIVNDREDAISKLEPVLKRLKTNNTKDNGRLLKLTSQQKKMELSDVFVPSDLRSTILSSTVSDSLKFKELGAFLKTHGFYMDQPMFKEKYLHNGRFEQNRFCCDILKLFTNKEYKSMRQMETDGFKWMTSRMKNTIQAISSKNREVSSSSSSSSE